MSQNYKKTGLRHEMSKLGLERSKNLCNLDSTNRALAQLTTLLMRRNMTPDQFIFIANGVFGEQWAYEISRRLGLNIRTVKRMGSGAKPIPAAIAGIMLFWEKGLEHGQA